MQYEVHVAHVHLDPVHSKLITAVTSVNAFLLRHTMYIYVILLTQCTHTNRHLYSTQQINYSKTIFQHVFTQTYNVHIRTKPELAIHSKLTTSFNGCSLRHIVYAQTHILYIRTYTWTVFLTEHRFL